MYKPGYLCTLLYEGIGSSKKQIWPEKEEKLDHNEMSKHVPATAWMLKKPVSVPPKILDITLLGLVVWSKLYDSFFALKNLVSKLNFSWINSC